MFLGSYRSRKKIAKYKAAAALLQKSKVQELQVISQRSGRTPTPEGQSVQDHKPNGDASGLKPGDIVVTWRDGNTSCLYSEPEAEFPGKDQEEEEEDQETEKEVEEEEKEVEKQEEVSSTEQESEGVKHKEE